MALLSDRAAKAGHINVKLSVDATEYTELLKEMECILGMLDDVVGRINRAEIKCIVDDAPINPKTVE
ncbi:hypothetical protein SAMN06265368_4834 [Cohaesibacter gelatinilyticus]|uniref:Uncharacterized protein n=1 Tax=Cohaesibacter gelatinilyticus TaxID=372072 RepID=A0A285PJ08_9HYPH|nr:hypothetical protein SAMN06265368_4834 [Cohaesibacter gelatinilyticus]